jgi:hypothetical protein
MGNEEFIFSVNTLVGCRFHIVKELEKRFHVEEKYQKIYKASRFLSRVISALSYFDDIRYQALSGTVKISKHPIYVLGHWRSGTTLLHNLLCSFKNSAYPTTYQTVFPNNLFFSKALIKRIMHWYLPKRRLVDQAIMHVDNPQEEDFALGNEAGFSFYYWFYFPRDREYIAREYMSLPSENERRNQAFTKSYLRFIKRCMLNTGGDQYIAKNPPNMARIPFLMNLFPESRFVYIDRNPYEVIESTFRFFSGFLKTLQLQDIDDEALWVFVFKNYIHLHQKYLENKQRIPPDHLVEIKYEQLIADPAGIFRDLHQELFQDLETDEVKLKKQLELHQDHRIKDYDFESGYVDRVNSELGEIIELQGYKRL